MDDDHEVAGAIVGQPGGPLAEIEWDDSTKSPPTLPLAERGAALGGDDS